MSIDNLVDIKKYITDNEISPIQNKKQKGEVFTPYEIIDSMLSALEKAYKKEHNQSIYENKKLTWYDNSSGIGNFMIVLYDKLYHGLKTAIPNNSDRKKHILENMIFMSELDSNNVNKCKQFIDPNNQYKLNINNGDSLVLDIKSKWNINGFDIIIGNPPYQKQNNKNNKARGGTNNNLYIDFALHSISTLNNNGYLVYIHPQNWRKIGNNILNEFMKYQLLHISLNYGGKLFKNVSVNTDFYVLQKKLNNINIKTEINNYNKKNELISSSSFIMKNIDFIPKQYDENIHNIISKIKKKGVTKKCIISCLCHKVRNYVVHVDNRKDIHKYPLYNTSGNKFSYFSSKEHNAQKNKKVIMSCSGKLDPFYDNGKYGTTQDSMYILVNSDNEGNKLVKILNTDLYKFLIKICQWGNFRNEAKLLSYLHYPNIINKTIDNDFINEYFGLTKQEIMVIKN